MAVAPETIDIYYLEQNATFLLQTRQFDVLEAMGRQFLETKACYPDGKWKLYYLYNGLDFPPPPNQDASLRRPYYLTPGFDFLGRRPELNWTNHLELLMEWVKAKPNSVIAPTALANGLVAYAWQARGHGEADNVTETGWKLFF